MCIYTCVYLYVYIYIYVCISIHISIYVIYIYLHMYIYICVCVCVYLYIHTHIKCINITFSETFFPKVTSPDTVRWSSSNMSGMLSNRERNSWTCPATSPNTTEHVPTRGGQKRWRWNKQGSWSTVVVEVVTKCLSSITLDI